MVALSVEYLLEKTAINTAKTKLRIKNIGVKVGKKKLRLKRFVRQLKALKLLLWHVIGVTGFVRIKI